MLLVSDEVICAFGRLGHGSAASRYGYQPDILTFAKGLTSGYSPLGGMLVSDRVVEPFLEPSAPFLHGLTFGGHPVSCAVALANLDLLEQRGPPRPRAGPRGRVWRRRSAGSTDLPIVGDVRGAGYFWAIELVRDQATRATFDAEECDWLLRGVLSPKLFEAGLICRADDRAEPMIVVAPPLIAGPEEISFIEATLRSVLDEAWRAYQRRR